jgi:hypothetical protein
MLEMVLVLSQLHLRLTLGRALAEERCVILRMLLLALLCVGRHQSASSVVLLHLVLYELRLQLEFRVHRDIAELFLFRVVAAQTTRGVLLATCLFAVFQLQMRFAQ